MQRCLSIFLRICFTLLPMFQLTLVQAQEVPGSDSSFFQQDTSVVNIGYGQQPKWMVTGALSSTTGTELRKTTAATLSNTLYGRIPGLTVLQGSGEPGYDAPRFYFRGQSSYLTNGRMLTFVDGFETPIEQLVPEEIATVTLLKDAASLAIYGVKGGNGVLLVTTKRGFNGKNRINFSAQTGIQQPMRLQKTLGSYQFATLYNEALANEGNPARYTAADLEAYQQGNDPYFHPNVNWQKEVLKKSAPISNYNMNFSGGSNTVRYFVLLNLLQNAGLYKNTDPSRDTNSNAQFLKFNFRSNVEVDVTSNLRASLYLGGRVEDRSTPAGVTSGELFNRLTLTPPNAFPVYTPNNTYGGSSIYVNPVASVLSTGLYNNHIRDLQTTFQLSHKLDAIVDGLSADAAISFNNFFAGTSTKRKTFAMYSLSKGATGDVAYTQVGQETPLASSEGFQSQTRRSNALFRLNYAAGSARSTFNAMAMYLQDKYVINGNNVPYAYQNFATRATYTFDKKYILEFTGSYSGTDNFIKGNRFGFFPAVSAGWIASEEHFLRGSRTLSYLKLRGSYGTVGNDQIGGQRYMYNQYFYAQSPYFFGDANSSTGGMDEGNLSNPGVTWEKRTIANVGISATVFQKITLEADVFAEQRDDILAEPVGTVPSFIGIGLPGINEGKVKNHGFEIQLGYNNLKAGKPGYYVEASAQFARNKIIYMSEAVQPFDYLYRTGNAVGQPFGLVNDGLYQAGDFTNGTLNAGLPKPQLGPVAPGDISYKDQNGDGLIDVYDYKPIGNPEVPEWMFAFKAGFNYKGFNVEAFFQGAANRTIYLNGTNIWAFQNNAGITPYALNRWTPATAATADYPRLTTTTNENNYRLSDFWQRNGSFIKLRTVEVSWSFPKALMSRVKLDNATIYTNGVNLVSWDDIKFADPETISGYPVMKSFNLGVRVGL